MSGLCQLCSSYVERQTDGVPIAILCQGAVSKGDVGQLAVVVGYHGRIVCSVSQLNVLCPYSVKINDGMPCVSEVGHHLLVTIHYTAICRRCPACKAIAVKGKGIGCECLRLIDIMLLYTHITRCI